jgi:HEAT repeat protein
VRKGCVRRQLVVALHVAAAAIDIGHTTEGQAEQEATKKRWHDLVEQTRQRLAAGGCIPFVAVPGPLPWAPSACRWLGVRCALTADDLARKEALGQFIQALKHSDLSARREAAWSLVRLGPAADKAVSALVDALGDEDTELRRYALWALERIGKPAGKACPEIVAAMRDGEAKLRERAAKALRSVGAKDEVLEALVSGLEDNDRRVQWASARTIGALGRDAAAAVPALIEALKRGKGEVISALGGIGPSAKAALGTLIEIINDAQDVRHCDAAWAVAKIDPTTPGLIDVLVRIFKDASRDNSTRIIAMRTLGEMGTAAKAASRHLAEAGRDEDPEIRIHALSALAMIDPQAAERPSDR